LTAKYERQQHSLAVPRYVLLALQRQVALFLKRGINGITFADKLVQAESKRWSARLWMWLALISGQQCMLDSHNTQLDRLTGEATESISGPFLTRDTLRSGANETTLTLRDSESAFYPAGQRVPNEALVIAWKRTSSFLDPFSQLLDKLPI